LFSNCSINTTLLPVCFLELHSKPAFPVVAWRLLRPSFLAKSSAFFLRHWITDTYASSSYDREPLIESLKTWILNFKLPFFFLEVHCFPWRNGPSLAVFMLLYDFYNCRFRHSNYLHQLAMSGVRRLVFNWLK
jgi:hypothetical protein